MNLKDIMLSERSQDERPDTIGFHLYVMSRINKSTEIADRGVSGREAQEVTA